MLRDRADGRRRAGAGVAACATVAFVASAILACHRETAPPGKPPRPVQVAAVEHLRPPQPGRYSATIAPVTQVPVAFKSSGYVDALLQRRGVDRRPRDLQQGDIVGRGDQLARVQQADYRARVQSAEARVAQADAAVIKARQDFERAEQLYAVRSLTQPDLDAARAQHDATRAQLTAAKADVDLAQSSLRDTSLTAPIGGVVLEKRIELGALASPGSVAFVLGDVRSVKAIFGVPDTIVRALSPGAPLAITTDALPGREFTGRISTVSPAADTQSRVFSVEVTVPNADGALKPGMIATVQLEEAARRAGVRTQPVASVPLAAIVRTGAASAPDAPAEGTPAPGAGAGPGAGSGGYTVFVVEKSGDHEIARARAVTVGDVVGNAIEVSGGLREGERVITTGATLVKDGETVRVIP